MIWWERAFPGQYPIVAYRCMESQLTLFQRKKSEVVNGMSQGYILRLPYTEVMLERRYSDQGDGPDWYMWERIPYAFDCTKERLD